MSLRFRVLCVGKPKDSVLIQLHERYAERIGRLGFRYETEWVTEVRPGRRFSEDHVRERESRLLLESLDGKGEVVALHPAGELLQSERLASRLEHRMAWTLVIGGPLGLHRSMLDRADWCWSLSPLTFPHELVRAIVAEQIYRATTLLRGIPYHKV